MSITVLIMSLIVERLWVVLPRSPYFDSATALAVTAGLMLWGGLIAFTMVWVEFTVIAETSALTFMVAGTFKEFVTGARGCLPAAAPAAPHWGMAGSRVGLFRQPELVRAAGLVARCRWMCVPRWGLALQSGIGGDGRLAAANKSR